MSGRQNVWQTAAGGGAATTNNKGRSTPQNRSNNASPAQSNPPQPPRQQETRQQPANVWTQHRTMSGSQGAAPAVLVDEQQHTPLNGFDSVQAQALLSRTPAPSPYKPASNGGHGQTPSAWGTAANKMADGKAFFPTLANQVASLENGG